MSETAQQRRLLPAAQPLVDRLGVGFFRAAPCAPGVYRFLGGDGELLYVGKAADLQARLSSYRRTHGQSRVGRCATVGCANRPAARKPCWRRNKSTTCRSWFHGPRLPRSSVRAPDFF